MRKMFTSRLSILLIFSLILLLGGCGSQDLSCAEAKKLVEAIPDFKQPFAPELMQGETLLPYGKSMYVLETGEQETPAQAAERKIREYYEKNPQIAVAAHLGLVEARVKTLDAAQPKPHFSDEQARRGFEEDYLVTE